MELLLASYGGAFSATPPTAATEFGIYRPAYVDAEQVRHVVTLPDGSDLVVAHPEPVAARAITVETPPRRAVAGGPTQRVPLGRVCGARSGDKGGNANVGLWARSDATYAWLRSALTVDLFRALLPEADELIVRRYELPNLRALNFVVEGILGAGVASSVRFDAQAKGLGEYVRSRLVDIPTAVLNA